MGDTKISWTDKTWGPVRGCSRISTGCTKCYAERIAARFSDPGQPYHGFAERRLKVVNADERDPDNKSVGRWTGVVRLIPEHLADPIRWKKPCKIFVSSTSDIFHEKLTNEEIAAVFGVMAACPQHIFQVLTKRAKRMHEWFEWLDHQSRTRGDWTIPHWELVEEAATECLAEHEPLNDRVMQSSKFPATATGRDWPLSNVWIGVSVENQEAADERIPWLLRTPAAVRFLSMEPLLGPVRLHEWLGREHGLKAIGAPPGLAWIICGCESGPGARPCDLAWIRSIRDQSAAAGVALWVKQAGDWRVPLATRNGIITAGDGSTCKSGGVIELPYLDGVQHAHFPEVR